MLSPVLIGSPGETNDQRGQRFEDIEKKRLINLQPVYYSPIFPLSLQIQIPSSDENIPQRLAAAFEEEEEDLDQPEVIQKQVQQQSFNFEDVPISMTRSCLTPRGVPFSPRVNRQTPLSPIPGRVSSAPINGRPLFSTPQPRRARKSIEVGIECWLDVLC